MKVMTEFMYDFAGPSSKIFNKIIQSAQWPRQWVVEKTIVLSKSKDKLPEWEDDLRTISKTQWLSKVLENIIGDIILATIDKYIVPGQWGGIKKSFLTHYMVRLLNFSQSTLDKTNPHAVVLSVEDLSKAYNRGSHQLVVEDLHSMHLPGWILAIIFQIGHFSAFLS